MFADQKKMRAKLFNRPYCVVIVLCWHKTMLSALYYDNTIL